MTRHSAWWIRDLPCGPGCDCGHRCPCYVRHAVTETADHGLDVEMFLAGLDSPNHSDESRRAWVALMWRDLKRAALAATETDKQAAAEELARALHLRLGHADTHPDFRGCSWCTPEAADILRAIEDIRKEASDGE